MNTLRMARDYLKRATRCLHEAGGAFNDQDYPMVVRRAQECVEPSLKATLRLLGIEYPREHDVSQILLSVQDRLPKWFNAEEYADHSRILVSKRGPAMYGHEELLTPASEIFGVKSPRLTETPTSHVSACLWTTFYMLFVEEYLE